MATDFKRSGRVGWDYMAESRGTAEGQRAAEATARNSKINIGEWIRAKKEAQHLQEQQAKAQNASYQKMEDDVSNTFYRDAELDTNNDIVNVLRSQGGNQLLDFYSNIIKDKDLDGRDKAMQSQAVIMDTDIMAKALNTLGARLDAWKKAVGEDSVSDAFKAKYQTIYNSLLNGEFEGGWGYDGDILKLRGVTSDGEQINLAAKDFEAHLPEIVAKGESLTDALDGINDQWRKEIQGWQADMTDPKTKMKFRKPESPVMLENGQPSAARTTLMESMENTIANGGRYGAAVFARDTMKLTNEEWQRRVQEKIGTKQIDNIIPADILAGMTPEQQAQYQPEEFEMTELQAEQAVVDELLNDYADAAVSMYNKMQYGSMTQSGTKRTSSTGKTNIDPKIANLIKAEATSLNNMVAQDATSIYEAMGINDMDNKKISINNNDDPIVIYDLEYSDGTKKPVSINLAQDDKLKELWMSNVRKNLGSTKYDADVLSLWHQEKDEFKKNLLSSIKQGFDFNPEIIDRKKVNLLSKGVKTPRSLNVWTNPNKS